jgi:hypothetical protein
MTHFSKFSASGQKACSFLVAEMVRARLTLIYATLFFAAGVGAARAHLRAGRQQPSHAPTASLTISSQELSLLH